MDLHLLQQADRIQSKCGFRPIIRGGSVLTLYKGFLLPMVLQPNQTAVFTKEITGETVWTLRAVSSDQGMVSVTGVRLQIQLPNGRFLIGGNGQDVGQFASFGSDRYLMDPELDCEPGSKIQVTLSDTNTGGLANPLAVNLLFEGSYKFYFEGGEPVRAAVASQQRRYQGIVNENILAPCYTAGQGPQTPKGYTDDYFIYSSTQITVPLTGPLTATMKIPIDNGIDFVCRRLLLDVEADGTVSAGSFLSRFRTGDGYALSDDYLDYARLINAAEYAHDWTIRGGDEVLIDVALVDSVGTGNMYLQVHLEGDKRRQS